MGSHAAELITTTLLFIADGAVLDRVRGRSASGTRMPATRSCLVHRLGRPQGRLGAPHRHADRGHAGRGDDRLGARPPLLDRLHGGRPVPAALLRLSVAVHLRHADAGDGRQPRAAVLRLGGRRPRVLSADRLLVPQARRPTPPRSRPSSSTASAISASRSASSRVFMLFGAVDFDTIFAQAPTLTGKTIHFLGMGLRRADPDLPAAVHGRDGQVGAVPAAHLAARRHGRPDAGLGADPCRHHGDGRRVHGGAAVAAVRAVADARGPSSPSSAPPPRSSPRPSAWCRTTSSGSSPIRPARSSATCSSRMGVGAYSIGMFHLFTHAFFKALLFLGSGSVITAMHHEQDMRKMGGLRTKIPFTYWMMVIGTLALTGFPLTAGYFSKDAIIEAAYAGKNPVGVLRLPDDADRRRADLVLFLAADLQDLPRPAARRRRIIEAAHESPRVDAHPARSCSRSARSSRASPFYDIFAGGGDRGLLPRLAQAQHRAARGDAPRQPCLDVARCRRSRWRSASASRG